MRPKAQAPVILNVKYDSPGPVINEFLKSKAAFDDFRLALKIKLVPNKENSGVQFRSERFGDYEMKGPQADAGAGWWGKLYEENGRAIIQARGQFLPHGSRFRDVEHAPLGISGLVELQRRGRVARLQRDLRPQGLGIKVFDAYRPVRATLAMVDWTQRVNRPDLLKDGYIASRSRHNLGLAIDCTLIDLATGRELYMGTPFDTFSPAAHTANASGQVAVNRQKLKTAMEQEGFVNYDQEWWHFSFDVPNPLRFDRVIQ